jgi:hypothetical protein
MSTTSRQCVAAKAHVRLSVRVPPLTQQLCPDCNFVMHLGILQQLSTNAYLITTFCRVQEPRPFFKGYTYILKVHANQLEITGTIIQRSILSNQLLSFSFLFIIPACLRNLLGVIRHLGDSSCFVI